MNDGLLDLAPKRMNFRAQATWCFFFHPHRSAFAMNTKRKVRCQSGFSLIELLTVTVIIGLIAAIAVPNLGSLTGAADKVKDRRNAQNIILSYTTGSAAGVAWPEGDVATQVAAVVAGQKPSQGIFSERLFRADVIANEVANTYPYIGVRVTGELFFDSKGTQNASGH